MEYSTFVDLKPLADVSTLSREDLWNAERALDREVKSLMKAMTAVTKESDRLMAKLHQYQERNAASLAKLIEVRHRLCLLDVGSWADEMETASSSAHSTASRKERKTEPKSELETEVESKLLAARKALEAAEAEKAAIELNRDEQAAVSPKPGPSGEKRFDPYSVYPRIGNSIFPQMPRKIVFEMLRDQLVVYPRLDPSTTTVPVHINLKQDNSFITYNKLLAMQLANRVVALQEPLKNVEIQLNKQIVGVRRIEMSVQLDLVFEGVVFKHSLYVLPSTSDFPLKRIILGHDFVMRYIRGVNNLRHELYLRWDTDGAVAVRYEEKYNPRRLYPYPRQDSNASSNA